MMQRIEHPSIAEYFFHLPEELIARYPVEPYDSCRLMRISGANDNRIQDSYFYQLPDFLEEGDLLVVNNTRVEARRIFLKRQSRDHKEGARIESVFLGIAENQPSGVANPCWSVLIKKRQRLKNGEILVSEVDENIFFTLHKKDDGRTFLESSIPMSAELFFKIGQMPIPPYMHREEETIDRTAYQNPFLNQNKRQISLPEGSVAAPTASLHFTEDLIQKLTLKKIQIKSLTLDIGYGTFAPLKNENFVNGQLHEENYLIPEDLADILQKKLYNKLYAVGTTSLRVLESVYIMTSGNYNHSLKGQTRVFLRPPHEIKSVDGILTNFHLPGSSLLMLVSCFLGKDLLMKAYQHAIEKKYRFFSYGDAMFIAL